MSSDKSNTDPSSLEKADAKLQKQKRLLSFLFPKDPPVIPTENERQEFPLDKSNFIKRTFFWWLNPLLKVGYQRTVTPEDLYILNDSMQIEKNYEIFMNHLSPVLLKRQNEHIAKKCAARNETVENSSVSREKDLADFLLPKLDLLSVVFKTFQYEYMKGIFQIALQYAGASVSPLLLKKLTDFVEMKSLNLVSSSGKGIGYAFGITLFTIFNSVTVNHGIYNTNVSSTKLTGVFTKALLSKSFSLDALGQHRFAVGKINSMMATDLNRILLAGPYIAYMVTIPISVVITLALLISHIGVVSLIGVALFLLSMVITISSVKYLMQKRLLAQKFTDGRATVMRDILKNFKMVKYYSWEPAYLSKVVDLRTKESQEIMKLQISRTVINSVIVCLPALSSMTAFCVLFAVNKKDATAGSIFASLSWFNSLALSISVIPLILSMIADASVSFGRISEFLSQNEIKDDHSQYSAPYDSDSDVAVNITDGSFKWPEFDTEPEQKDENHMSNIRRIFNSLMNKDKEEPNKVKEGNSSDNSNIEAQMVISISSDEKKVARYMTSDKKGDQTVAVSEMGKKFTGLENINLEIKKGEFVVITGSIGSGKSSLLAAISGIMQKQHGKVQISGSILSCGYPWIQSVTVRENILFGLPYDKEKYTAITEACSLAIDFDRLPGGDLTEVGESGVTLSGGQKARINLARAVYADSDIILLDDVLSAVDAKVGRHIVNSCLLGYLKDKTRVLATHQLSLIGSADKIVFLNGDGSIDVGSLSDVSARNEKFRALMQHATEMDSKNRKEKNQDDDEDGGSVKKVVSGEQFNIKEEEERAVNMIKFDVAKVYIKLASGVFKFTFLPLIIILYSLYAFFGIFSNTWLSFWVAHKFEGKGDHFYMGLYICFGFLTVIVNVLGFSLVTYGTVTSAKKLNIKAVQNVMRLPMSYVDVTPVGRILNRFTKDTDVLDNEFSEILQDITSTFATIVGSLILSIIYLPWFAIAVPPLLIMFTLITGYFQASAREIKRLEAVQRSFVYSQFGEALSGMSTIKAYKSEERFLKTVDKAIDKMNEAYYLVNAGQRYLSINLTILVASLSLLVGLLCCFRAFNINAASTGLLLSYIMEISNSFVLLFRFCTQVENQMNSVERLKYYAGNLPQEAPAHISSAIPPPSWPEYGGIKFENVNLRYREGMSYSLKNMSIEVKPHEKIGICGRTGAGKSTLTSCIYRLNEPEGLITIDGIDISKLGLAELRTKLSIIPQDPVLFSGTIRDNLDPFNENSDDELWDALRRAHLVNESMLDKIKEQTDVNSSMHKFHLLQIVEEDGGNFSLGERQLLALARALVRKTRILILDEATSSVDYETDAKIQDTISHEFAKCTILCIAHRLKTIIKYDRILVLEEGEVEEFDTPLNLFHNENGIFRSMCDISNISADDFL
ncbi:unnamed protein product [Ambrosiozyma monospora]|uniref:Unnamed protein product n=1 Tax=Ambrosiozyma monospora TaxID=43982 RepID=A0A9W6YW60_AMBMO|nr:unnamed protein product [Ambrosiozyma monospora]